MGRVEKGFSVHNLKEKSFFSIPRGAKIFLMLWLLAMPCSSLKPNSNVTKNINAMWCDVLWIFSGSCIIAILSLFGVLIRGHPKNSQRSFPLLPKNLVEASLLNYRPLVGNFSYFEHRRFIRSYSCLHEPHFFIFHIFHPPFIMSPYHAHTKLKPKVTSVKLFNFFPSPAPLNLLLAK